MAHRNKAGITGKKGGLSVIDQTLNEPVGQNNSKPKKKQKKQSKGKNKH